MGRSTPQNQQIARGLPPIKPFGPWASFDDRPYSVGDQIYVWDDLYNLGNTYGLNLPWETIGQLHHLFTFECNPIGGTNGFVTFMQAFAPKPISFNAFLDNANTRPEVLTTLSTCKRGCHIRPDPSELALSASMLRQGAPQQKVTFMHDDSVGPRPEASRVCAAMASLLKASRNFVLEEGNIRGGPLLLHLSGQHEGQVRPEPQFVLPPRARR